MREVVCTFNLLFQVDETLISRSAYHKTHLHYSIEIQSVRCL